MLNASFVKTLLIAIAIGISACTSILDYGSWNKSDSIKSLRQLVSDGDVGAQTALGQRYEAGIGVPQDLDRAKRFYIKASERGDPLAMFLLGQLLEFDNTDSPDYQQAVVYYRSAAEMGHAEAQARLAHLYEQGRGVPQDIELANKWYSLATQQWNYDQRIPLGSTYATGRSTTRNSTYTIQRFRRAAMSGVAEAQFDLAHAYETGDGVPHDKAQSEKWYKAAAEQGHARAIDSLKRLLEEPAIRVNVPSRADQTSEHITKTKPESASTTSTPRDTPENSPMFLAHLSSYRSLELASADTDQLSESLAHLLGGVSIKVKRVDFPTMGQFYRVQAGPFSALSSAKTFCTQVLRQRTYCRVLNIMNQADSSN